MNPPSLGGVHFPGQPAHTGTTNQEDKMTEVIDMAAPAEAMRALFTEAHDELNTVQEELRRTQEELSAARLENTRLHEMREREGRAHHDDIALIGKRLNLEADDRAWCRDFDEAVEELNEGLHVPLPVRTKTFSVRVTGYVRVQFVDYVDVEAPASWDDDSVAELGRATYAEERTSSVDQDKLRFRTIEDADEDDWDYETI